MEKSNKSNNCHLASQSQPSGVLSTREVSETSTDWEWDHSQSYSHEQDSSSHSEWQTSGLTRSEIKYKNRQETSTSGEVGEFSEEYQVQSSTHRRTQTEIGSQQQLLRVDRSVQADLTAESEANKWKDKRSHHRHRDAENREPYVHSRRYHSTISRAYGLSGQMSFGELFHANSTSGSSTCSMIERLMKDRNSARSMNVLSFIDTQRNQHIAKVKHELRRIQKLNKAMCTAAHNYIPTTTTSSSSQPNSDSMNSKTCTTERNPDSSLEFQYSNHRKTKFTKPKPSVKSSSTKNLQPESQMDKATSVSALPQSTLEQKLDDLISAFNVVVKHITPHSPSVTDALQLNGTKKEVKDPCNESVPAQPVSFFHPIRSDLPPVWIHCAPGYVYALYNNTENEHYEALKNSDLHEEELTARFLQLNLNDYLLKTKPTFVKHAEERSNVLQRMKNERIKRAALKREWVRTHGPTGDCSLSSLERNLPPKGPSLMTSREMRELTNRKYNNLPEVNEKKLRMKSEQEKETNRLMRQLFAGKLRQKVLKGELNLDPNKSIIRR